ncbi:PDF receptor isoform X2 [Photinus pyralis]|uniref:PDF receptor isoform X2 n=1 Tax=Photinus pyralis TaxID=7054 RepID=UPI00126753EC|nr:PDF receptor isoform X2 [Photinus pyralis]
MMSQGACVDLYKNFSYVPQIEYCSPIFDNELCWPPTPAGSNVTKFCPQKKGTNATQFAYRICKADAQWEYNNITNLQGKGYTYYDNCYLPRLRDLINMCKVLDFQTCTKVGYNTRIIEMVGLGVSLLSLAFSLFIFFRYRVLRNNRTKIHKNLFLSTILQIFVRLVIYIDQSFEDKVIENTPYLCESIYVLLEYAKTAMFMWMFIEGLYLHNVITVTVFQEYSYMKLYFWLGWTLPLALTIIWVIIMIVCTENTGCWYLYYFLPYYWILEGPRLTVIIVNLLFLLNIVRVLVVKLRESHTSEIQQVRKAVRAAIFLLPLMGIANILFLVDYRLFKNAWKFALWSYSTYFLTTFQGLFLSVLYCFCNGEVISPHTHLLDHNHPP